MIKIVLLRHGESTWNKENRFTGWTDVPLSAKGKKEAKQAGKVLKKEGFSFDIAFDSVLKRSNQTREIVLKTMKIKVPVIEAWQLNERHYGALQGLNKAETAAKYGEAQVLKWRRSYDIRPPALEKTDKKYPGNDPKYKNISKKNLPTAECLKDTVKRVLPYWKKEIAPRLKKGKKVIIFAHGNSLRALVKHLSNISDRDIIDLNIPTGIPLVYELNKNLKPIRSYYLASPQELKKRMESVKNQGKVKK